MGGGHGRRRGRAGGAGRHAGGRSRAHPAASRPEQPHHHGGGQRRLCDQPRDHRGRPPDTLPRHAAGLRRHHAGGRADDHVHAAPAAGGADLHQRHGGADAGRQPRVGQGLRDAAGGQGHAAGHGDAGLGQRHGAKQLDRGDDRRHADAGDGGESLQPEPERDDPGRTRPVVRPDHPQPQQQQPDRRRPGRTGLAGSPHGASAVRQHADRLHPVGVAGRGHQRPQLAQPALLPAAGAGDAECGHPRRGQRGPDLGRGGRRRHVPGGGAPGRAGQLDHRQRHDHGDDAHGGPVDLRHGVPGPGAGARQRDDLRDGLERALAGGGGDHGGLHAADVYRRAVRVRGGGACAGRDGGGHADGHRRRGQRRDLRDHGGG